MNFFARIDDVQWTLIVLAIIFCVLYPLRPRLAWRYARFATLTVAAIIILAPFAWLFCAAFKDKSVLMQYIFLPPLKLMNSSTINFNSFRKLFAAKETVTGPVTFWRYIGNSLFLASTTTFLGLVLCSMGGYALAKYRFPGRNAILLFMLASLTIPAVVLLAPNFDVIYRIGWMDTYKALIIPSCASAFGVFLFRQAILTVPDELLEAGRMDGCSEFRIYLTLVMPLVRPMTGAFCLITFLGAWNAFLGPNIYVQTQSKLPLTVVLNQYMQEYQQDYGVFLAGTLLAIIPPAILFFALQREFISGLASGAVKQ